MKVSYTNEGKSVVHIGNMTILPGHTRDVEEHDVPGFKKGEDAPVAAPVDPLAELLKGNVASVVAALDGMLLIDIERLGDLEQQGQARKGVLSAIAEIKLVQAGAI